MTARPSRELSGQSQMPELSIEDLAGIMDGSIVSGHGAVGETHRGGYAFDSRLLKAGDIFFALKGDSRDGSQFVADAADRGAAAAVVPARVDGLPSEFIQIEVDSPIEALQRLAVHARKSVRVPVVAISGSNGKTTTKEMLAHILSGAMQVHRSPGNFNNHIGVPLTILGAPEDADVIVLELGSNHRGEIAKLARIARPNVGVLTNVGSAHIGFFGSVEAIASEKSDVLRCLESGGTGVVNADDPALAGALADIQSPMLTYAIECEAGFRAEEVRRAEGGHVFNVAGEEVRLKVPGRHNIYNALAAIAAASLLEVGPGEAARALEGFEPVRVKTISRGSVTIMDDSYNANPDSVRAAADILAGARASRRIFILGEMLELGSESERLHREVGSMLAASGTDILIGIGGQTRSSIEGAISSGMDAGSAVFFKTKAEAKSYVGAMLREGDAVLIKGSRLAGLEEICDFLISAVEGRA